MARNRTVRLAVLGNSVQRSANTGYPSNRSSALRRRVIVGVLVLVSLVSMVAAPVGARLAHRLPVATLKKIFAGVLISLSAKMLHGVFA